MSGPKAWAFSVDSEVSLKVFKWAWGCLHPGVGVSSLAGVEEVGQGEGNVGGHEGTDVGQMWVGRRVPSGRNLGPWEVLEQGRSMWEGVLRGWLGQDAVTLPKMSFVGLEPRAQSQRYG